MEIYNKGDLCSIVDIGKGDYFFKYRDQLIGKNVEFICPFFEERKGEFLSCEVRFKDKVIVSGVEYEEGVFDKLKLKKIQPR